MPSGRSLCERDAAGLPGDLRHLAVRFGFAQRRDVGWVGRTGAADGRLRADASLLRLPGGAAAGIADAKMPDMQAGWEQAISNVLAGLSGLNMVYEAAGMHASLLGFCLESLCWATT